MKIDDYPAKLLLLVLTIVQTGPLMAADKNDRLSVTQLVSAVLNANPQLDMAKATWLASVAKIKQQSTLDDPQFQYSFAPLTIEAEKSDFGQRFEISQKLPFPGKLQLQTQTAEFQAESKHHTIAEVQLLLASTAKGLFADWYFIHQAIAIDKLKQGLLNEFRDISVTQYATGRASKQQVLHAEMALATLKHQSIVLQNKKKILLTQLNTLLNRPVDSLLAKPEALTEIVKLANFEQLQAKAMRFRPELKALTASIKATKAEQGLAELAYYPDLKLSAGYNSLWDNKDKRFNIGIGINIPLDQSKRRAAEQQAKANSQYASWQKNDLQAKIKQQLAITYAHVEESLHLLQLYQQQLLPLAKENVVATTADYQNGKADFLGLINSKNKRLQIQLETERALAETHRRFAELEKAVGSFASFNTVEHRGNVAK